MVFSIIFLEDVFVRIYVMMVKLGLGIEENLMKVYKNIVYYKEINKEW